MFRESVRLYRSAVDYFIGVCLAEWDSIVEFSGEKKHQRYVETLCHQGRSGEKLQYDFDRKFYKFPSYLRHAAISTAIGKVASYKSNLANYEFGIDKRKRSVPIAGNVYPAMFRDNCFVRTGTYTARIKVFIRNTWDWLDVELKKSDVDYILRHCTDRKECAPVLRKRGKEWFLDFAFEEQVALNKTAVQDQTIVAVDLGLNKACTCCVMTSDGTILDRKFLSLSREQDSLTHAINRIKKAQQHRNYRTPRLWAKATGINDDIAVKTATFIIDTAIMWSADTIVFEHLDIQGKKRGTHKQRLHHWRTQHVQSMVENKAHRLGMRISRVSAWGTSKLAYDGTGYVERGVDGNYSICRFKNGKIYNCDLSASYNIGARYYIREILKSLPETARLDI